MTNTTICRHCLKRVALVAITFPGGKVRSVLCESDPVSFVSASLEGRERTWYYDENGNIYSAGAAPIARRLWMKHDCAAHHRATKAQRKEAHQ